MEDSIHSINVKENWIPDSSCKKCYGCLQKFTFTKRKHHCRMCGLIFCWKCSDYWVEGKYFKSKDKIRFCVVCYDRFMIQKNAALHKNVQSNVESQSTKKYSPTENQTNEPVNRSFYEANYVSPRNTESAFSYQLDEAQQKEMSSEMLLLLEDAHQLQKLFSIIFCGRNKLLLQSHKHMLQSYAESFTGTCLVQWLVDNDKAANRQAGVAIGQALLDSGFIKCVLKRRRHFADDQVLYQPSLGKTLNQNAKVETGFSDEEPIWAKEIPSATDGSFENEGEMTTSTDLKLDLNLERHVVSLRKPVNKNIADEENFTAVSAALSAKVPSPKSENQPFDLNSEEFLKVLSSPEFLIDKDVSDGPNTSHRKDVSQDTEETMSKNLDFLWKSHEEALLTQLMDQAELPQVWYQIIASTARTVSNIIRPDVKNDSDNMDIRSYVHFKKLCGDFRRQCQVVNGTVCTKNVLHRSMKSNFTDPAILLIGFNIDIQSGDKLEIISLQTIQAEEEKCLSNIALKIKSFCPDIVLIEKRIAFKATEILKDAKLTLIVDVKNSVMKRVARCTQGQIVDSIQALSTKPRLGLCHSFYTHSYTTSNNKQKTLLYFDGCPTHAGCTLILKGPNEGELRKIKTIIYFMIFSHYNWKLEKSFLIKEFAFATPEFMRLHELEGSQNCNAEYNLKKSSCHDELLTDNSNGNRDTGSPTDPLRQLNSPSRTNTTGVTNRNEFARTLKDLVLSVSPYHRLKVPYLMSDSGFNAPALSFLPKQNFYSRLFEEKALETQPIEEKTTEKAKILRVPTHRFITQPIADPADSWQMRTLLSDFRARGASIIETCTCEQDTENRVYNIEKDKTRFKPVYDEKVLTQAGKIDSLNIMNHQRLPVMFCSYSVGHSTSKFCAGPDTLIMNFYGDNDICLGDFLEKYCFNPSYDCPSRCSQPALSHIRRFAHGNGSIEVLLQKVNDHNFKNSTISMWTWCKSCDKLSQIVTLAPEMWAFSFAKYLEMRLYEKLLVRRGYNSCNHSIHQNHYHYFAKGNIIAVFKYVTVWARDLVIPSFCISYNFDPIIYSDTLDRIKQLSAQGYSIFNGILTRLSRLAEDPGQRWESMLKSLFAQESQQRLTFKESIESIQKQLSSIENADDGLRSEDTLSRERSAAILMGICDQICCVNVLLSRILNDWNSKVQEMCSSKKKEVDKSKGLTSSLRYAAGSSSALSSDSKQPDDTNIEADIERMLATPDQVDAKNVDAQNAFETYNAAGETYWELTGGISEKSREQSSVEQGIDCADVSTTEKKPNAVRQIISSLRNTSSELYIKSPFPQNRHFAVLKEVRIPVIINDEQPSSIIAHALASEAYRQELLEIQKKMDLRQENAATTEYDNKSEHKNFHIELHFEDSTTNFYCKIFYAEQFRQLRSLVFAKGEDIFIRSLSTCFKWDAKGGKSGSAFCKTADDRFVLKQMSQPEEDSFIKFGPKYITYITECEIDRLPTALTKIVGVFYVIWKNSATGKEKKLTLLVMENLFYQRNISFKFDLKGSLRNRLVNISDKQEAETVLLDENLQKMLHSSPLYLRSHCKQVLTDAITRDSSFLAEQLVMDYSLLVGIDDTKTQIIVGIIDYLRTFTWDKKLETMFKSTVWTSGAAGEKPTVVSPGVYRTRFCEAMDRYFVIMPDRWFALGQSSIARNM